MEFLSLALQCSFLPIVVMAEPETPFAGPGYVVQQGQGSPAKSGDRVTVDFWVQDASGKEIANSERRGISQTFSLLQTPADILLSNAAIGAKEGEERIVVLFAETNYPEISPLSLIKKPGLLVVRLRVARIDRR